MKDYTSILDILASAPSEYPVHILYGILEDSYGNEYEVPIQYPTQSGWGRSNMIEFKEPKEKFLPILIDTLWLSISERKFYQYSGSLDVKLIDKIIKDNPGIFENIIIGYAPGGLLTLWLSGGKKQTSISYFKAKPINFDIKQICSSDDKMDLDKFCSIYYNRNKKIRREVEKDIIEEYSTRMLNFKIRYKINFCKCLKESNQEKWNSFEEKRNIEILEFYESSIDASFDLLPIEKKEGYRDIACPEKLMIRWKENKDLKSLYLFPNLEFIINFYSKFFGSHKDTPTDFILNVDPDTMKFSCELYRSGLPNPVVIPSEHWEAIGFKNDFEFFKTKNYNKQPKDRIFGVSI